MTGPLSRLTWPWLCQETSHQGFLISFKNNAYSDFRFQTRSYSDFRHPISRSAAIYPDRIRATRSYPLTSCSFLSPFCRSPTCPRAFRPAWPFNPETQGWSSVTYHTRPIMRNALHSQIFQAGPDFLTADKRLFTCAVTSPRNHGLRKTARRAYRSNKTQIATAQHQAFSHAFQRIH